MSTGNDIGASFGIEDTMEMGSGNKELLDGIFNMDTDPDDITDIKKEPEKETKQEPEKTPQQVLEEEESDNKLDEFLESENNEVNEKEPEKIEKRKTEEQETNEIDEINKYTALARDLVRLGVFSQEDDETDELVIDTPEEFLERFNAEKRKGAIETVNNFIGQFGDDYQKAFDAIFVKGVNPKQYFDAFNEISDFSELNMEEENNQELVIRKAMTEQGFDPEDVDSEIERLKTYGDLESVSARYHKVLVKKQANKLKELEKDAQELQQRKAAIRNQYIQNVQVVLQDKLKAKEFDGIPINNDLANELQDFLLVDKYKTATGETLTDFDRYILELKRPENHALKVKVALLLKTLEKDPSLSTIQKRGVTKKTDELFSNVARQAVSNKKDKESDSIKSWFL